jgi:hypothetical protein
MVLSVLFLALAVVLALALAYLPMRLLLAQMAKRVTAFIQRQRERRLSHRDTPDRRKAPIV